MRVTFLFAPLRVSRDFIDYPYFADLGALQAAAVVRGQGMDVRVVDALAMAGATLTRADDEVVLGAPLSQVESALTEAIADCDVLVAQLSVFHRPPLPAADLGSLLRHARKLKKRMPILLADLYQSGQHYVGYDPGQLRRSYPEADKLLLHEAETMLPLVLAKVEREGRFDGEFAEEGGEVDDLDALPFPAWDLVDRQAYFRFHQEVVAKLGRGAWAFPILDQALPWLSSRGCPFRCVHCSSNPGRVANTPKRQRRLSPTRIREHLDALQSLGARKVIVLDELANASASHFDHLLTELDARELGLELPNGLRADYVVERHLEVLSRRATTLSISAESGVQRVVDDVVQKQLDLAHIERVCAAARNAGLATLVHFMIGLPGESRAEINETLAYARHLKQEHGAQPSVQYATPLPGTQLSRAVDATRLPLLQDWSPHFQRAPSPRDGEVDAATLARFRETFELWNAASEGPKKAILNVTYRCNNHCTFCAVGTRTQVDGNFQRQRELLVKYRKAGVTLLDLDGGEPTLNPRLFALIRFARRIGYEKVNVTTNGRLAAYDDYARELCTSGVTSILFSVHGHTPWLHAANVGVPEALEQTLQGIANVRRHAPPTLELGANVTVTLSNHRHLRDIAAFVREQGLSWLNIQFLTPFGRATQSVAPDSEAAVAEAKLVLDEFGGSMKLCIVNAPWCWFEGYERFVVGDLLKLERHMIFVDNEEVNLFEYLASEREYRDSCEECARKVFCGGFYRTQDVAEPTWLIEPRDLLRPVAQRGFTGPARRRHGDLER
ncbi:MAG: radical SAM protein [Polyangiaceae bacterium]